MRHWQTVADAERALGLSGYPIGLGASARVEAVTLCRGVVRIAVITVERGRYTLHYDTIGMTWWVHAVEDAEGRLGGVVRTAGRLFIVEESDLRLLAQALLRVREPFPDGEPGIAALRALAGEGVA